MPILKRWTWKTRNLCLIDCKNPKTADLAGLEGLPNLQLQQTEGLADFGEILVFICETEDEANLLVLLWKLSQLKFSLPSTGLVFVFQLETSFCQDESETSALLQKFVFD